MGKKGNKHIIGIDIGGTKILTVLLDPRYRLVASAKARVKLNKGGKYFFSGLVSQIHEVLDEAHLRLKDVEAIGVGCPGMIDFPDGVVRLAPNIPFLKDYPLRSKMKKQCKVPVWVENDVNAGLYGEYCFGSARNFHHVVGIFVGTGVGGALIMNGRLFRGATGGAGEIGHMFLSFDSAFTSSYRHATVENVIGRHGMAAEAALLAMKHKAAHLFRLVETDVQKMKSGVLAQAIRDGDRALRNLVISKAKFLGLAMANVVNLLNPELIILGGGVIEALGSIMIPEARRAMKKYALKPLVKSVKVLPAELGDYAVAKGAAKLAQEMTRN